MKRRDFLQRLAAAPLLFGAADALSAEVPDPSPPPAPAPAAPAPRFVGLQISPSSLFAEGIEPCLDRLQDLAGVNALLVYTHRYQGYGGMWAAPTTDPQARRLPLIWVRTHEAYYRGTFLRHAERGPGTDYADRDILDELAEPCRRRGIRVIARFQEGVGHDALAAIAGWSAVGSIDITGRRTMAPCWNHPAYRAWWLATVEDLFKSYPTLGGLKIGSERNGPFSNVLINPRGDARQAAVCFCTHCRTAARARGLDPERALEGMTKLVEFTEALRGNRPVPVDGAGVTLLRMLMRYPEILAWEQLYHDARESLMREVYGVIKQISPTALVGWHVHHSVSMDPITRAMTDYQRMAEYGDFIKPVLYHDITGVRLNGVLQAYAGGVLKDLPPAELLPLLYALLGYDPTREPTYQDLTKRGFSTDYIYRETRRCVTAVGGRCAVYPGIGLDIGGAPAHDATAGAGEAVTAALRAGAGGIIISREYDEMREPSLRAVGRALRAYPSP